MQSQRPNTDERALSLTTDLVREGYSLDEVAVIGKSMKRCAEALKPKRRMTLADLFDCRDQNESTQDSATRIYCTAAMIRSLEDDGNPKLASVKAVFAPFKPEENVPFSDAIFYNQLSAATEMIEKLGLIETPAE